MKFTKMQGAGNDYVYVNCFEEKVDRPERAAVLVSDRHFGIGADGLVLICPSSKADVRMRMFNADGSEGAMCGNAIRCVGKYVYDRGMVRRERVTVETLGGIKELELQVHKGTVDEVTVDMGIPKVISSRVPEPINIEGSDTEFVGISVGNPHAVYFREEIDSLDLERMGLSGEFRVSEAENTFSAKSGSISTLTLQ